MTTRLAGEARVLLPFNRGTTDGGAVNDTPADVYRHATDYLWHNESGAKRVLRLKADSQRVFTRMRACILRYSRGLTPWASVNSFRK